MFVANVSGENASCFISSTYSNGPVNGSQPAQKDYLAQRNALKIRSKLMKMFQMLRKMFRAYMAG
jgi:hypothetical protein